MKKTTTIIIAFAAFCAATTSCNNSATTAQKISKNWHCAGTEPFWSANVSAKDNTLTFNRVGEEKIVAPCTKIDEKDGSCTYTADKFALTIKKEACSDGMSDTKFEYSAHIDALQGCAEAK